MNHTSSSAAIGGKIAAAFDQDARWRSDRAAQQLYNRVRNLPDQLARARARVQQLEAEAARLRMRDLIVGKDRCHG